METKSENKESAASNSNKSPKKFATFLKDSGKNKITTRLILDPSEYLNISHIKLALISFHCAKIHNGKTILRFDDANPAEQTDEYVEIILEDLKRLGLEFDIVSYTSNYFYYLLTKMTKLIHEGKCCCDNSEAQKAKKKSSDDLVVKCRDQTPEENLKIWEKMQKGDAQDYCVRAKGDMLHPSMLMRDPVLYRRFDKEHYKTSKKYKVYPTFSFSCPIIDSIEGVTNFVRVNDYSNQIQQ